MVAVHKNYRLTPACLRFYERCSREEARGDDSALGKWLKASAQFGDLAASYCVEPSLRLHLHANTRNGPLNRRDTGIYVDAIIRRVASDTDFDKTGSFQSVLHEDFKAARIEREYLGADAFNRLCIRSNIGSRFTNLFCVNSRFAFAIELETGECSARQCSLFGNPNLPELSTNAQFKKPNSAQSSIAIDLRIGIHAEKL